MNRVLHENGWVPVTDPLPALADLLGEAGSAKDAFRDRVDKLKSLTVEDQLGREDVRALLAAYERAMDRFGRLLVDAARLNLDERIVAMQSAIEEAQASAWGDILEQVLSLLPSELDQLCRQTFGRLLRSHVNGQAAVLPTFPPYVRADLIEATAAITPGNDQASSPVAADAAEIVPETEGDVSAPKDAEVSVELASEPAITTPHRLGARTAAYPDDEPASLLPPKRIGPDGRPVDGPLEAAQHTAETLDELFLGRPQGNWR